MYSSDMTHLATAILAEGPRHSKTVGLRTAACSKWDVLLLVVVTFLILELIALLLHADNNLLSSYWETYKVYHSVIVLDQMVLSVFGSYRKPSFSFGHTEQPKLLAILSGLSPIRR